MKKFLLTLLLLFSLGLAASAATVTINAADIILDAANGSAEKDGFKVSVAKNNGTNNPYYNEGLRIYAKGTLTVSGANISKIVFGINSTTNGKRYTTFKPSIGNLNPEQAKGDTSITWEGDATEVTFTVGDKGTLGTETGKAGQIHITSIVIYPKDGGDTPDPTPDAPVISAATDDVVYAEGETASNEVVKGTEVTFSVSNYTEVLATFGETMLDETDFVDGSYTATITADAKMEIIAYNGDIDATHVYNFTVKEEVTPNPPATDENKYTITFKGNGASQDSSTAFTNNADLTKFVASGLEYISGISETANTYHSTVGVRLSSGKYAGKIKFALSDAGKLKATKIVVSAKVHNKDTNVTLSVNGTSKSVTGSEFTDITYDLAGNTLEYIELAAEANKRVHVNGITVYYAKEEEPEFELVGISHNPHFNKTNVEYNYTLHVNNHIEGRDSYEAVLTVNGQEFRNTEHTLATDTSAESAMLREQTFNSTHKLNGIVKVTGLDGDTEYAANFAVLHNGTEIYSEPVKNFKTSTVGIEDVTVDGNEAAEYFNLQGVRVAQPEAGRIYIVRRGAKATKELVK